MSGIGWKENIRIDVRDIDGRLIDTTEFNNQIEDTGLDYLARSLASSTFDMKIRYMGWGSSNTAVSSSDNVLGDERGRKIITVSATSTTIGIIYNTVYLSPSEATTDIEELAWFASSSAVATADSGTMISRVLYSRSKTSLESLTVTRTDTFSTGV